MRADATALCVPMFLVMALSGDLSAAARPSLLAIESPEDMREVVDYLQRWRYHDGDVFLEQILPDFEAGLAVCLRSTVMATKAWAVSHMRKRGRIGVALQLEAFQVLMDDSAGKLHWDVKDVLWRKGGSPELCNVVLGYLLTREAKPDLPGYSDTYFLVKILGHCRSREAIPTLRRYVDETRTRNVALIELGRLGDAESLPVMRARLKASPGNGAAAEAMLLLGKEAGVSDALAWLQRPDSWATGEIVAALPSRANDEIRSDLLKKFDSGRNHSHDLFLWLAQQSPKGLGDLALRILEGEKLRSANGLICIWVLHENGKKAAARKYLTASPIHRSLTSHPHLRAMLYEVAEREIKAILEMIRDPERHRIAHTWTPHLCHLGKRAEQAVLELMDDQDVRLRIYAYRCIAAAALQRHVGLLQDRFDEMLRLQQTGEAALVATALSDHSLATYAWLFDRYVNAGAQEFGEDLKRGLLRNLSRYRIPDLVDLLERELTSADERLRYQVASDLVHLGDRTSLDKLVAARAAEADGPTADHMDRCIRELDELLTQQEERRAELNR